MYRKFLFLVFIAVGLTACRSHYEVTQVERSRILIDSRYDAVGLANSMARSLISGCIIWVVFVPTCLRVW